MTGRRITVEINGKEYPCYQTMGAMLRFREETGREATDMKANSLSDLCTYLWCCITSASRREGVGFDMPLMDFADAVSPEDALEWSRKARENAEAENAGGEKKKAVGILELYGFATGRIGITREEFCRCTAEELQWTIREWNMERSMREQSAWERMRLLACIVVQPMVKAKLTPEKRGH